tara:strand:+ start:626 stop:976 length:351 start_codon:yes stop_codon:yes gene_type:complete
MKRLSILLFFISFTAYSQTYSIDKIDGTNVKSMNMSVTITEDSVISRLGAGAGELEVLLIDYEEKDGKKYYYTQIGPPVTESFYVLYTDKKKTILEQHLIMTGMNQILKYQVTLIE